MQVRYSYWDASADQIPNASWRSSGLRETRIKTRSINSLLSCTRLEYARLTVTCRSLRDHHANVVLHSGYDNRFGCVLNTKISYDSNGHVVDMACTSFQSTDQIPLEDITAKDEYTVCHRQQDDQVHNLTKSGLSIGPIVECDSEGCQGFQAFIA